MMQRLRELSSSSDPAAARAAALLAAMPPLDAEGLRPRAMPPLEPARRRIGFRLRFAVVFAVSLASAAAAAATLRGTGWLRARHADAPAPVEAAPLGAPAAQHKGRGPAAEGATDDPPAPEVASPQAAPEPASEARARAAATPHARPSRGSPKETVHGGPTASGEDESALLVGAVRALRRDGDAARAAALAEECLQRYPHGVQVEEAMALAMEAAVAASDSSAARRDAQRYLASFPSGRFADRAARVLASQPR